ncbi:MAG: ABC transporter ATP-binding protein [Planctomycetota bacterium]|nr:ABC transporter ATP-binding protein [Planctomycetota bacterium]
MTEPVISLRDLDKRYGSIRALTGLTLDVAPGPVGLLGPNGAGKTTLLKLLLGQLRSSGGTARIAGHDPSTRAGRLEVRRRVGYMPEGDCLIPHANAVDLIIMLGRLTGMSFRDAMTRTHEVLDYVGLEEARYRMLGEYSTGMKQRLKLAQALVHDPDILLLDEPTNGLDPKGRRHMLDLVHDLGHAQGKNVFLCSHLLPDVEQTCRDVVVLHRGRVLETGAIEEMTRSDETWLRVEVAGASAAFADGLAAGSLAFEPEDGGGFRVRVRDGAEDGDEIFDLAARCGVSLTKLAPIRSSLEDVFLSALEDADK